MPLVNQYISDNFAIYHTARFVYISAKNRYLLTKKIVPKTQYVSNPRVQTIHSFVTFTHPKSRMHETNIENSLLPIPTVHQNNAVSKT